MKVPSSASSDELGGYLPVLHLEHNIETPRSSRPDVLFTPLFGFGAFPDFVCYDQRGPIRRIAR